MTINVISDAVRQLVHTKGISEELILSAIKDALIGAYKKTFGTDDNAETIVDEENGEVTIYARKEIVDEVSEDLTEIALETARNLNESCEIGDEILIEVKPEQFSNIATQHAKQIIIQRLREYEKNLIYNEFIKKKNQLITGTFQRERDGNIFVDLEKCEAILPKSGQSPRERYSQGDRIKAVIVDVTNNPEKGAPVVLSRSTPLFVQRIFEIEVPEIAENQVEIINAVRDPGSRTKISVDSKTMDPVGACVGMKGIRIQTIIKELEGEKIDIVRYSDDIKEYIANALSPATVERVAILDEEDSEVIAIVTEDQLSLAIGKAGQNVKLAAKLVGWNINIKTVDEFEQEGYEDRIKEEASKLFTDSEEVEEHDIELLELSAAISSKLREAGFKNIEDLIDKKREDFESIPGIGPKSADTIMKKIEELVEVVDDEITEEDEDTSESKYTEKEELTEEDVFGKIEDDDEEDIKDDDEEDIEDVDEEDIEDDDEEDIEDVDEEDIEDDDEEYIEEENDDDTEEEDDDDDTEETESTKDTEEEEYIEEEYIEEEELYCPVCNTPVNETMRVCPGCGTELEFEYEE